MTHDHISTLRGLLREALLALDEEESPAKRAPLLAQARAISREIHDLEAAEVPQEPSSAASNVTALSQFREDLRRSMNA